MERFGSANEPESHDSDEDESLDDFLDPFELLVRKVSFPPPLCYEAPCRCNSDFSHLLSFHARCISNIGGQFDYA